MANPSSTMARRIGMAAIGFEEETTGHAPQTAGVILSDDAVVIRLHGALSPAEMALAKNPAGAAQVQEFHRQLFALNSESLRKEIAKITNVEVRDATVDIAAASGTIVQLFWLAQNVPTESWTGNKQDDDG